MPPNEPFAAAAQKAAAKPSTGEPFEAAAASLAAASSSAEAAAQTAEEAGSSPMHMDLLERRKGLMHPDSYHVQQTD